MKRRCIIFTAFVQGDVQKAYHPQPDDYILCADGGYLHALRAGVGPDLVIGDCDGGVEIPPALLWRAPKEKDDTDTMLCIRHCLEADFSECVIVGGIGGRLDHTMANIQALAFAHTHGLQATMQDEFEHVFFLQDGRVSLPRREGCSLSLFSYSQGCEGVCEHGVQYPLDNATLTNAFPLGVSNVITEEQAHISVRSGLLLLIQSRLR